MSEPPKSDVFPEIFLKRTFQVDANDQYGLQDTVCNSVVIGESGEDVYQK